MAALPHQAKGQPSQPAAPGGSLSLAKPTAELADGEEPVEPTDRLALEIDPSSLTLAVPEHHQDQTPPVRQDPD